MGGVAVVTDSTADLPFELAAERGVRIVPMSVTFGAETFVSGMTIRDTDFYARLRVARQLPTTAQPAPAWFEEAYADCADGGFDAVVSIHVSEALSGTFALATRLAEAAPLPVEVVDSRQVGAGLALTVLDAQRCASAGGDVAEVLAAARTAAANTLSLLVVNTLDHLKRGGRLTGAQALVGRALRVKPILGLVDGRVEVIARTRTWSRALDRVAEMVTAHAAGAPVRVVVSHALDHGRAQDVWQRIDGRVEVDARLETVTGPVLGTHTGPGAVAIAVAPAVP